MIIFTILSVIFVAIGFILGFLLPVKISTVFFPYISVVVLVVLDCFLYSIRMVNEIIPGSWRIILRLVLEIAYGCFLIFFGEQGGLDLYLVAVLPLGASIFYNLHRLLIGSHRQTI